MTRRMGDAVTANNLPRDLDMYAAYIDGNYANLGAVATIANGRPVVTIAVRTGSGATVFDTEPGNPGPDAAAQWVVKERARGNPHAGIYTMRAWWGLCVDALRRAGVVPESVPFWIADSTGREHFLAGSVATQWLFAGGFDQSVVADFWPGVDNGPSPAPAPTPAPSRVGRTTEAMFPRQFNGETIYLLAGHQLRALNREEWALLQWEFAVQNDGVAPKPVQMDNPLRIYELGGLYGLSKEEVDAAVGA